MKAPLFRPQAVEKQQGKIEGVVVLRQPFRLKVFALLAAIAVFAVALLLVFGQYSRRQTVVGVVVGSAGEVKVLGQMSGTLESLYVRDGAKVNRGDLLATVLKAPAVSAQKDVDAGQIERVGRVLQEHQAKIDGEIEVHRLESIRLTAQRQLGQEQATSLAAEMALEQQRLELVEARLADFEALERSKTVSKSQLRDQRQAALDAKATLEALTRQLASQRAGIRDIDLKLQQMPAQLASRMADYEAERMELEQRRAEAEVRRELSILAPISGTLTAVQVRPGQTVYANAVLATVIQESGKFEAEIYVPTRAIGFVREGQAVNLRYQAFPHQRFGIYGGKVTAIAKTILMPKDILNPIPLANEPYYRVVVTIDKSVIRSYGEEYPLQAGMLLDADIVLDRRPLWQWLLDPVLTLRGRFWQ